MAPRPFFVPRQLSGDMQTWGLWQQPRFGGSCPRHDHNAPFQQRRSLSAGPETYETWTGEVRKTCRSQILNSYHHIPTTWDNVSRPIFVYVIRTLRPLCLTRSVRWEKMNKCSVLKHKALWLLPSPGRVRFLLYSYSNLKRRICNILQLQERSSWVVMPFNADFQTDSAPTTVTIRSWYRSSDLDSMYRSLRTLPLWRKGWARIGTWTVPEQLNNQGFTRIY